MMNFLSLRVIKPVGENEGLCMQGLKNNTTNYAHEEAQDRVKNSLCPFVPFVA